MALPSSGQITYNQIAGELNITTTNANMDNMTSLAIGDSGITNEPDSTADWYGYSHVTLPNAPTNAVASAQPGLEIDITWTDNSNNEDGFTIYREDDPPSTINFLVELSTPNQESYTDANGLEDGVGYRYYIYSRNSAGLSSSSAQSNTEFAQDVPA